MVDQLVFVVDDDPDIRELIVQTLGDEGFRVLAFSDGELAVATAQHDPPGLILLDLMMPRVSGWEVVSMLQQSPQTRHIPVIFVSASRDLSSAHEEMAVSGYLAKPFDLDDLVSIVRTNLGV